MNKKPTLIPKARECFRRPVSTYARVRRFDGVKSAFYIWLNGHRVVHSQGSMSPPEFDVTPHVQARAAMKARRLRACTTILLLSALPVLAWAHGGGLDSMGCHNDRKRGEYHCQKGELAGQSFPSKQAALRAG